ncbi:hypothetical protein LY90DRAFT_332648, partial [Neocallimastix californiae]
IYYICCILTLGTFYLILHWFPKLKLKIIGTTIPIAEASELFIENIWNRNVVYVKVKRCLLYGKISDIFPKYTNTNITFSQKENINSKQNFVLKYFIYQYTRFVFNPVTLEYEQIINWKDPNWDSIQSAIKGIESNEIYNQRKKLFGSNVAQINQKSTLSFLLDEVLHPFYIFQICSIIIWCTENYYYYAFCIFAMSVFSTLLTLKTSKKNLKNISEMSKFTCPQDHEQDRDSPFKHIDSSDLVPGDIMIIAPNELEIFPCDAILLKGDCIVNESILTGESMPVKKTPIKNEKLYNINLEKEDIINSIGNNCFFADNRDNKIRKRDLKYETKSAYALVVRTGFNTVKGSLIRSMLFPRENYFKFYRDSFFFVFILSVLAFLGFGGTIYTFIKYSVPVSLIFTRALDLITVVVPPSLPATMSIGTNFAISKLKKLNIFCISPNHIIIGGKLNLICFDKTGTLTENGLHVHGNELIGNNNLLNDNEISLFISKRYIDLLRYAMATCHNLNVVEGQLIGDPLDIEMFKFIDWSIQEKEGSIDGLSTIVRPKCNQNNDNEHIDKTAIKIDMQESCHSFDKYISNYGLAEINSSKNLFELGIIKVFEFVSHLRRMSVIVRRMYSKESSLIISDSLEVFVKGAPEVIHNLCRRNTIPSNFSQELIQLTNKGYRVIAVGYKPLGNIKYHKLMKIDRDEIESDLEFLGFIIFENSLKPGTKKTIDELNNSNISSLMCTGDNILTGISVARECNMINKDAKVKILKFVNGTGEIDENTPPEIIYGDITYGSNNSLSKDTIIKINNEYLAMTGDIFDWILHNYSDEQLFSVLENCKVFARMLPDQKKLLVEKFQENGYCVSFCGDGANDCGALKSADVGLSQSEAEASVAAPFTSRNEDLKCVLDVIKEGRAALVTNFSCFKYMAIYSLIQFTTVSLLYHLAANLGDTQFLFIDLFLILPVAITMGRSKSYHKIYPKAPSANLISFKVLVSLIGQVLIQMIFQFYMFYGYEEPENNNGETILCCENTVLFYVSCFQYLIGAFVFSIGPPYRQSILKNCKY